MKKNLFLKRSFWSNQKIGNTKTFPIKTDVTLQISKYLVEMKHYWNIVETLFPLNSILINCRERRGPQKQQILTSNKRKKNINKRKKHKPQNSFFNLTLYAVLSDGRQLNTIKQTFGNMLNKIWQCLKRLFVLCWECFNFSNFFRKGGQ